LGEEIGMDYRNLGNSGLKVSPLGLGTMMLGAWGNTDHDDCVRIIQRALDAGINLIDTSNNYGDGDSEIVVGKALRGRRDQAVLATKVWAPMGEGPNQRGLSRKAIEEQVEQSLRRLQTDVIDLYQIHRPDPTVRWEETLGTLDDLVRRGKVRYLGCSSNHYSGAGPWERHLPAWEIVETLWISERRGYERFVSYQPPYSILRRSMEAEHFPMALRHRLGILVWSPLEGGWLSGKYRPGAGNPGDTPRARQWIGNLDNPKFARRLAVVEQLIALAAARGMPLAQLATAWVLRHPQVSSVIIGPRTMEQLESSLESLDREISDEDAAAIDRLVPPATSVL
jgi:aryl-alcohol dehydrogenase-like predicted oxidoreductase